MTDLFAANKPDVSLADGIPVLHVGGVPAPKSNIPADRLAAALNAQNQRLREEQAWTAELGDRAAVARMILEDCAREHEASAKRQAALSQTILQYEDLLRLAGGTPPSGEAPAPVPNEAEQPPTAHGRDEAKPKLVARLGDQHYRMLYALRDKSRLSLPALATASVVSQRRVKVQMAEDAKRGVVSVDGDAYELTPEGVDLLQRFEDFRRNARQELPSLNPPLSEADRDEADPATPNEGDEG